MTPLDIASLNTVVLDLGGVLIDVDYQRTARAFHELGMERFEELFSKARQTPLFDRFETGAIGPAGFRQAVRDLFRPDLSDRDIDTCWNAMLGSVPPERMKLVEALRQRYRVLLLSNTNAIHVPAFLAIIRKENGIADFRTEFDGCYFSCELHLRKPDRAIFDHVLKENHATPDRTLFIDDSPQHVEGARAAGLHAEHLDLGSEDVIELVERLGLLA